MNYKPLLEFFSTQLLVEMSKNKQIVSSFVAECFQNTLSSKNQRTMENLCFKAVKIVGIGRFLSIDRFVTCIIRICDLSLFRIDSIRIEYLLANN